MNSPLQNPQQFMPGYNTNVIPIQGEEAVNNYPVQLNYRAMLIDEENKTFYFKTRDQSGNLLPLRKFKYEEITPQEITNNSSEYVTKEDFNKLLAEVKKLQKHSRDNRKSYKPYNNNK